MSNRDPRPLADDTPLRREWRPSELETAWNYCRHDWGRFLKLLVWIDALHAAPAGTGEHHE